MSNPAGFVWFDNRSAQPDSTTQFYADLLGWNATDGPGMKMFAGESGPVAGVSSGQGGWLPYAQVEDVEAAVARAEELGATTLEAIAQGPAGRYAVVQDPGGARVALWQRSA